MLPAAASFKKQGANKGAIASFLVSTPESGIDSIAITYALLDPIMTVVRPIAAFTTGIFAGVLENLFSFDAKRNQLSKDVVSPHQASCTKEHDRTANSGRAPSGIIPKLLAGLKYGCEDVWGDIVFWFFGGLLIAGVITVFIPENISEMVLGGELVSMLTMLLIGMPLYICATASTPVAAALLLKGASPGAVLVFLLAGPATNITSLSVLTQILGKRGTFRYLIVIAASSILFGLGVDWLYSHFSLEPRAIIEEAREAMPYPVKLFFTSILLLLSVRHFITWGKNKWFHKENKTYLVDFPPLDSMHKKTCCQEKPAHKFPAKKDT